MQASLTGGRSMYRIHEMGDGQMVEWAVRFLRSPTDQPFLSGRRHLPASLTFLCTAEYFDMYPPDSDFLAAD